MRAYSIEFRRQRKIRSPKTLSILLYFLLFFFPIHLYQGFPPDFKMTWNPSVMTSSISDPYYTLTNKIN